MGLKWLVLASLNAHPHVKYVITGLLVIFRNIADFGHFSAIAAMLMLTLLLL